MRIGEFPRFGGADRTTREVKSAWDDHFSRHSSTFENLDTNFVRWNIRHKKFKYLTGGKEVGDKVYFAQYVEGVWYKVKAVITEKQMDDKLFNLTVKSTTGLGVITFRAEKQPDGSVLFTHIESFGARRSFFGNFVTHEKASSDK